MNAVHFAGVMGYFAKFDPIHTSSKTYAQSLTRFVLDNVPKTEGDIFIVDSRLMTDEEEQEQTNPKTFRFTAPPKDEFVLLHLNNQGRADATGTESACTKDEGLTRVLASQKEINNHVLGNHLSWLQSPTFRPDKDCQRIDLVPRALLTALKKNKS